MTDEPIIRLSPEAEEAIRKLPRPPEVTAELRQFLQDYNIKRKANRFAQDNHRPLPFPEIEAARQRYMEYITGKEGAK